MDVTQAKKWLKERLKTGAKCPVCNRFAKMYCRKLNAGMCVRLIDLYKISTSDWVHLSEWISQRPKMTNHDFAYLVHWGLLEQKKKDEDLDKKSIGYWRITQKGIKFVNRMVHVKSHVFLYDNRFFGFEGEDVGIDKCLGEKFSYKELMRS